MAGFNIKNPKAEALLEDVVRLTGEGKTEAVIRALERYRAELLAERRSAEVIASIRGRVHTGIAPEHLGAAPSEETIEADLGMPEAPG